MDSVCQAPAEALCGVYRFRLIFGWFRCRPNHPRVQDGQTDVNECDVEDDGAVVVVTCGDVAYKAQTIQSDREIWLVDVAATPTR